jgi:signal transduction histidine kinase
MIKSFRTRLIWLSVLVSGLALVAFGLGSWWLIRGIQLERLDTEVRAHAEREVDRQRSAFAWQRFEADVLTNFGLRQSKDLLLLAQDAAGQVLYKSSHWPANFDTDRLPWPSQQDVPKPGPWIQLLRPPPPNGPRGLPREGQWGPPMGEPSGPLPDAARLDQNFDTADRPPPGPRPASASIFRDIAGQEWRIGLASTERSRVLIAVNAHVMDSEMTSVRNAFLVAIPLALLMIGLGAWVLSSRAMHPLKKLTEATRQVTAKGLDQRLSSIGKDLEFAELIGVFNGMLERLERSFQQANRFSADAAHELKTPLAILQGQLERAIQQAENRTALQRDLTSILDEVRRLSTISRKLLLLSQADAGRMRIFKEPFDLTSALEDVIEDTQMLAPQLQVTSTIDTGLKIAADSSLLRQVLHNLISNAIKYNLPGGWIHLATHRLDARIEVCVSNASAGIPVADEGKLFERFYRADTAHSRQVEGVGLGLSLSREIARAHGGELMLKAQDGQSVEFVLLLPLA